MKNATKATVIAVILSVVLLAAPLTAACARPSPAQALSPTPAPAQKTGPPATPATTSAPAPPPTPAPKVDPVAGIISGAKREGAVTAQIVSAFVAPEATQALQKGIKDKYAADLKIGANSSGSFAEILATAVMEYKTGVPPSYDIMGFSSTYVPEALKSGAFEVLDWAPLVEKGTDPALMPQESAVRGSIVYISGGIGLQYNPKKISAAEAPKKLADLLDPKWQGRLGIIEYPNYWAEWAFILGKDNVFSLLRSLIKTKPFTGTFSGLNNKYLVGEIDLAFMNVSYVLRNQAKGMPTEFRNLDLIYTYYQHLLVAKGAKNPNAARLLAIFLTSPDGVKVVEKLDPATIHPRVAGSLMHGIYQEGLKEGLKPVTVYTYPGMVEFMASPEYEKWQKEAQLIIKGAG